MSDILSDDEAINAAAAIAEILGEEASAEIDAMSVAILVAFRAFGSPDPPSPGESVDAVTQARFQLVGYAVRNFVIDGYQLGENFMKAPVDVTEPDEAKLYDIGKLKSDWSKLN